MPSECQVGPKKANESGLKDAINSWFLKETEYGFYQTLLKV